MALGNKKEGTNLPRLLGGRLDWKESMQGLGGVEDDSQALSWASG